MRAGIDLGTTYCAIAYVDQKSGRPHIIKNSLGLPTTPSVLYFSPDGNILHGQVAKDYLEYGDPDTEAYFKYRMGDDTFEVVHHGKAYRAEDLSAILLSRIVKEAEESLGETIDEAVITVPAYFNHPMREATKRAGEKAGLKVLATLNEPTAAIFSYGLNQKGRDETLLIYDLGGGTFDITIARVTDDEIRSLGCDGDHELGGRDWDNAILSYLSNQFWEDHGEYLNAEDPLFYNLRVNVEKAKKALSAKMSENIQVTDGKHKSTYTITNELFREISNVLMLRTESVIERLFAELNMGWRDIDGVILVGGSTRMKMIGDYVREMSGKEPYQGVDPDQSVALGAAIRACTEEVCYIKGSDKERLFVRGAKKLEESIAHSLGFIVESQDRHHYVNNILIPKNSPIPSKVSKEFKLDVDSDEALNHLDVYILQGEMETLSYPPLNATCLGKYVFRQIQYRGQKEEVVRVTYQYDGNGMVKVEALQKSTGVPLPLTIEPVEEDMGWVLLDPSERILKRQKTRMDIVMAFDLSGSMCGDPIKSSIQAARRFVDQFDLSVTRVGIVGFASRKAILLDLTQDKRTIIKSLDMLSSVNHLGGGTSAIPFEDAKEMLTDASHNRYVLVLTDGLWAYPDKAVKLAHELWAMGIETIAVGFGDVNEEFLRDIASRSEFAQKTDLDHLSSTFLGIARRM